MYVTQALIALALCAALVASAEPEVSKVPSPVAEPFAEPEPIAARASKVDAPATSEHRELPTKKTKSNRYGELRIPSALWPRPPKPNNFGFPLAFAASDSVPTFAAFAGAQPYEAGTASRLKSLSYLATSRPRKPQTLSLQSQSQFPELGLSVLPQASSYKILRKYRGRIPRLPLNIKGVLLPKHKDLAFPKFIPLLFSSSSLKQLTPTLKPHKSKFVSWAYLGKRPKYATKLPQFAAEDSFSGFGSPLSGIPIIEAQKLPIYLNKKPYLPPHLLKAKLPVYKPSLHYLEGHGPDADDDEHYPKANEPILPQEPESQPQSAPNRDPATRFVESFLEGASGAPGAAAEALTQLAQNPNVNIGQLIQQGQKLLQQASLGQPQRPEEPQAPENPEQAQQQEQSHQHPHPTAEHQPQVPAEESRDTPVYREVPLRHQRPHHNQALRGLNAFEALTALGSSPGGSSVLSSIPFLARPGVNIQQMINSAFRGGAFGAQSGSLPSGPNFQSEHQFGGHQPQHQFSFAPPSQQSNQFQNQNPFAVLEQTSSQFNLQYRPAPAPLRQSGPPSHKNIVLIKERAPLRSYASGWVPKDMPHDWQPGPIRVPTKPGYFLAPTTTATTTTARPPIVRPTAPVPATKPIKQVIRIFLTSPPEEAPVKTSTPLPPQAREVQPKRKKHPKAPPTTSSTTTTTTTSTTTEVPVTVVTREAAASEISESSTIDIVRTSSLSTTSSTTVSPISKPQPPPSTEGSLGVDIEIFSDIPRIDKKVGLIRNPIWI